MGTVTKKGAVISYVVLFCALIMVRNSKATVDEAVMLVPLAGGAQFLDQNLVRVPACKD